MAVEGGPHQRCAARLVRRIHLRVGVEEAPGLVHVPDFAGPTQGTGSLDATERTADFEGTEEKEESEGGAGQPMRSGTSSEDFGREGRARRGTRSDGDTI